VRLARIQQGNICTYATLPNIKKLAKRLKRKIPSTPFIVHFTRKSTMQTLRKVALSLVLALAAAHAIAGPTNLVKNGDFETLPVVPNDPWTYPDPNSNLGIGDGSGSANAHSGLVYLDLSVPGFHPLGILSQNILNLAVGSKYTLTFDLQRYNPNNDTTQHNQALVRFGGVTLLDEADVYSDWKTFTFTDLIAGSTSMLLEFGNIATVGLFGNQLDNISLVLQDDSTDPGTPGRVPAPGTLALMAGGLGMLGAARRRRVQAV
jgi:hypothetical protein